MTLLTDAGWVTKERGDFNQALVDENSNNWNCVAMRKKSVIGTIVR